MKVKTAEMNGLALDWVLAGALKKRVRHCSIYKAIVFDDCEDNVYLFTHTDPATCMGLIKEYRFPIFPYTQVGGDGCLWQVNYCDADVNSESWESLEQAVARCVVQTRLGDEVDVPDELCGVQS